MHQGTEGAMRCIRCQTLLKNLGIQSGLLYAGSGESSSKRGTSYDNRYTGLGKQPLRTVSDPDAPAANAGGPHQRNICRRLWRTVNGGRNHQGRAGSSRVSRILWYGRYHYVVEIEKALCWNTEPMSCQELFYRQAYKIVDSL